MKKISVKKVALTILAVVAALILAALIAVYALWHNELLTIASIRTVRQRNDAHLDGAVYTMHVKGGFYLDEFVEQKNLN